MPITEDWSRRTRCQYLEHVTDSADRSESAPLRVLAVGHEATTTGAPLQLLGLLRHWSTGQSVNATLLLRRGGDLLSQFRDCLDVVEMTPTVLRPARKLAYACGELKRFEEMRLSHLLRRGHLPERAVVYANTLTNVHVTSALARRGFTVVLHAHELAEAALQNAELAELRSSARLASAWLANSQAAALDLAQLAHLDVGQITVVPPYITRSTPAPVAGIRGRLSIAPDARIVMGCGALTYLKGVDVFVEAAAAMSRELAAEGEQVIFVWVGEGPKRGDLGRWRHAMHNRHLEKSVIFVGPLADPRELMLEADLFAFFSREDGFGLVNLEAASVGLPIICVRGSGGAPEFVGKGAGIIAPTHDPRTLAMMMRQLLDDPARRSALGGVGKVLVEEEHAPSASAEVVLKVLVDAAARQR